MNIWYVIIALVLGGVIGYLLMLLKSSGLKTSILLSQENLHQAKERVASLETEVMNERQQVVSLKTTLASVESDLKHLRQEMENKQQEFLDLQEKAALQFKNLANEIFEDKSRRFTEQNKMNLQDLLKPFSEQISDFKKSVNEAHKDTITGNSSLKTQLENLSKLNQKMTVEAENLTRALKGDKQVQGAWGEMILETILEKSGLVRDREYQVQESFNTEDGRLRPDVIVHLPNQKMIIIDSKVSLNAYSSYVNAPNEEERTAGLKAHLLAIRQHLKRLSDKNYAKNISDTNLDFIIMFIPIEPAYMMAMQNDPLLYEEALEKRVVFVCPTLLIPTLQMIKNLWKQEYQSRNVIDIATKAGEMYDKFVGFTVDLMAVGKSMESAKSNYEDAMRKLSSGTGNLVKRSDELKKLGAKASKEILPKLVERACEE